MNTNQLATLKRQILKRAVKIGALKRGEMKDYAVTFNYPKHGRKYIGYAFAQKNIPCIVGFWEQRGTNGTYIYKNFKTHTFRVGKYTLQIGIRTYVYTDQHGKVKKFTHCKIKNATTNHDEQTKGI